MTYFSQNPLQTGIYTLLTGDATLMSLINGVYDQVPENTLYPFVTMGENMVRDWSNIEKSGTEHHIALRVWSQARGRKEAGSVMERMVTLLHGGGLSVSGHNVAYARFLSSDIILQKDGRTYRGTLNFRILLTDN